MTTSLFFVRASQMSSQGQRFISYSVWCFLYFHVVMTSRSLWNWSFLWLLRWQENTFFSIMSEIKQLLHVGFIHRVAVQDSMEFTRIRHCWSSNRRRWCWPLSEAAQQKFLRSKTISFPVRQKWGLLLCMLVNSMPRFLRLGLIIFVLLGTNTWRV